MLRRWLWRPEVAFFLICFLGISGRFRDRAFNDPGSMWHVKVGERILSSGFMLTDPFTFTFADRTWIPQQWIGEVSMALAHGLGGFDGVLLGFSVFVATLFTWLFARAVRDGMHPILASVVVGGAMVVSAFHFYARPHMATLAGMAATMAILVDYERGRVGTWHLWALIPLFALWTNIHGGVLGGTLTLGLAVAGWLVVGYRKKDTANSTMPKTLREAAVLVGIVAACGLTPFVNPFGMEMIHTWQKIVGSKAMAKLVSEHQPLKLFHTAGQVVLGMAVFYAFVLSGVPRKQWRVTWLLPAVWFLLTLKGIRQGPLFAVMAAVVIADAWSSTKWYELIKKHGDTLAIEPSATARGWGWLALPVLLLLIGFSVQSKGTQAPFVGRGWAGMNPHAWPVELREPLEKYAASVPAGTPIFNDANLGGFVLYTTPTLKIFMDDRFELYGDDWILEYADVIYKYPERFDNWAKQYGFTMALVGVEEEQTGLEKHLVNSSDWQEVGRCSRAVLFQKRSQ